MNDTNSTCPECNPFQTAAPPVTQIRKKSVDGFKTVGFCQRHNKKTMKLLFSPLCERFRTISLKYKTYNHSIIERQIRHVKIKVQSIRLCLGWVASLRTEAALLWTQQWWMLQGGQWSPPPSQFGPLSAVLHRTGAEASGRDGENLR